MISHRPYSRLAGIYDRIMDHVDYDEWARYIALIFERYASNIHTVLETACGTGSISLILQISHGYCMTGMDLSHDMLRVAAGKIRRANRPVRLIAADMTSLPVSGEFDAVLCLYDSINYLINPADFTRAVGEAAGVLRSGGLFVFDVCTMKNSLMFFSDKTLEGEVDSVMYERTCRFHSASRIQENTFVLKERGRTFNEIHLQKIYFLDEVERMTAHPALELVGIFDDMTLRPGSEGSERIHFVLRKK